MVGLIYEVLSSVPMSSQGKKYIVLICKGINNTSRYNLGRCNLKWHQINSFISNITMSFNTTDSLYGG